eukprot:3412714-Rhodomonas_salina.1
MDEEALSQLPTQPAHYMASVAEEEQPERRAVLPVEPLLEIAKTLWDPTLTHDISNETRDNWSSSFGKEYRTPSSKQASNDQGKEEALQILDFGIT